MATEMNDAGIYYPIWGTCQGFEEMATWPTNTNVLGSCKGTMAVSLPTNFTSKAETSKLYGAMPQFIRSIMQKESVTPNYHDLCLTSKEYARNDDINKFFVSLSTSVDENGLEFVSSFESREYPFYGVQFHPEKVNFLHAKGTRINQSLHAVLVGQYFGNFLVSEAKRNHNTFKSLAEESRFVIQSYQHQFIASEFLELYCLFQKDVPNFDP